MAAKKSNLPNLKEAFEKQDAMDDKKKGIKENSKEDLMMDKKGPGPQPFPPFKKGKK